MLLSIVECDGHEALRLGADSLLPGRAPSFLHAQNTTPSRLRTSLRTQYISEMFSRAYKRLFSLPTNIIALLIGVFIATVVAIFMGVASSLVPHSKSFTAPDAYSINAEVCSTEYFYQLSLCSSRPMIWVDLLGNRITICGSGGQDLYGGLVPNPPG